MTISNATRSKITKSTDKRLCCNLFYLFEVCDKMALTYFNLPSARLNFDDWFAFRLDYFHKWPTITSKEIYRVVNWRTSKRAESKGPEAVIKHSSPKWIVMNRFAVQNIYYFIKNVLKSPLSFNLTTTWQWNIELNS